MGNVRGEGGGAEFQRQKTSIFREPLSLLMGYKIIGGVVVLYQDSPCRPNLQVLTSAQVRWSKHSGIGSFSREESGEANQALVGIQSGGGRPVKVHCR